MLKGALVVQVAFLLTEVFGGLSFNSLALLSDAAHMLADVGAIALALFAASLARRPATPRRTYGYLRAEVLAALANATTLIAASLWIVYQAVGRFIAPQVVQGNGVAVVATLGIAANLVTAGLLMRADRTNLNVRATLIHSLIDAMSCAAVLVSGVIIAATGIHQIDSVASLLIAAMAISGTWGVFKSAMNLLLDAAPDGCSGDDVKAALIEHDAIADVEHVRVWSVGQRDVAVSAHLRTHEGTHVSHGLISGLRHELEHRFGAKHVTLQVAPTGDGLGHEHDHHDHGHNHSHGHHHGHSHAHAH
jgi:cobalt-zinc-cadmium efflux system protein